LVGCCDVFRGRQREARAQGGAGARRRLDVEAAAGEFGALAHAHQPRTGAQPLDVEANPVIPDRDLEGNVLCRQRYFDVASARVPGDVGQCLLRDAEADGRSSKARVCTCSIIFSMARMLSDTRALEAGESSPLIASRSPVAPINLTLRSNAGGVDGQDEGTEEGFSLHG
jgi:hypothetical protein